MEIKSRKEESGVIVFLKGRMDAISAPQFDKRLDEWMNKGETNFIIDFGQLDYISSAGLRSILAAAKNLKVKDGQILLSSLRGMVKEVFEISGFSSIFKIFESVETALAEF